MPTKPTPPPLSPRFQRVLALDGPTFGRPRPAPDELQAIRGVLAEGPAAAQRLNLARAMAIATDNAPDAETARLLARILKDGQADAALRRQAAALLGDIPLRSAAKALTESLPASSPGLEATLLKALARCGDVDAARAIAARPATPSARLARLRDYARSVIAYRTGSEIDDRAERALLPPGETVEMARETPDSLAAAIRGWRGSTYGVRLGTEIGFGLQCGSARHLVMLAADLGRGQLLQALGRKRRIAGLVAMQDERGSATYLARRLIVTRPGSAGIDVAVVGTDGELDLLGVLRTAGNVGTLSLRSHGSARPPIAVDGTVEGGRLRLELRTFRGGAVLKRSGEVDPAAA
jgi:hypothetical protein